MNKKKNNLILEDYDGEFLYKDSRNDINARSSEFSR